MEHTESHDPVNHPLHYTSHPSGVECITVTKHMNFCVGNAIKYLWRAGLKNGGETHVEDLEKAQFYIAAEIQRIKSLAVTLLVAAVLSVSAQARDYPAAVTRVVDGDTIVADIDLGMGVWMRGIHVRLGNGNAPEKNTAAGVTSKAWMEQFAAGKQATLHTTEGREFDKYGRLLALVLIGGKDAGTELLRSGNGHGGPGRKDTE